MKTKIISLLMVLVLFLTACGGGNNGTGKENEKGSEDSVQDNGSGENNKQDGEDSSQGGESEDGANQSGAPEEDTTKVVGAVKLTKKGTVSRFFSYDSFMYSYENDRIQLVGLDGKTKSEKDYAGVNALIRDGFCVVEETPVDGVPRLGVADAYTGKELAPCEAVNVQLLNERYLLMVYKTGVGDKDNWFGFYFDSETHDMVYILGYGKVLDLEEGRFVPNIKVTSSMMDAAAVGPTVLVDTDEYATCIAYDPDGKELGTYEYMNPEPDSKLVLQGLSETVRIYDEEMNSISEVAGSIYAYDTIDGISDMLIYYENGKYRIVDLNGKVLSGDFDYIGDVVNHECIIVKEGDSWGVADMDGNEIIPCQYDVVSYLEPGYFAAKTDEGYYLFTMEGEQIYDQPVKRSGDTISFYADGDEDYSKKLLVLETGELLTATYRFRNMGLSLVYDDNMVYDQISGEIVFEDVADCFGCGDSIYVRLMDEDNYTRYMVEYA